MAFDRVEDGAARLRRQTCASFSAKVKTDLFRLGNFIAEDEADALLEHFEATSGLRNVRSAVENMNGCT